MSAARVNGSSARISFIGFSRVTFYDTPHCLNTVTSSAALNAVLWTNVVDRSWFRVPGTEYSERRTQDEPKNEMRLCKRYLSKFDSTRPHALRANDLAG